MQEAPEGNVVLLIEIRGTHTLFPSPNTGAVEDLTSVLLDHYLTRDR